MESRLTSPLIGPSGFGFAAPSDPAFSAQWHLYNLGGGGAVAGIDLNVAPVWEDYTGRGVRVGVIDNGVQYSHGDLAPRYLGELDRDFRDNDFDAMALAGDDHGTAVAGVIGADLNGTGAVGVAFGAEIVGYRIGYGADGNVAQVVNAFKAASGLDIANNSWGYTNAFGDNFAKAEFAPVKQALEEAVGTGRGGLGTVFVFAAGNARAMGDDVNFHNHQNSPYVITVGALDSAGKVASFSTPGAALLVSAPGVNIATTDRLGADGYSSADTATVSGTSFAAPAVSGVVALMLEANAGLGYRDVQEILAYSARQVDETSARWTVNGAGNWNGGGLHFNNDYGFGLVDAHAAVRLAETWQSRSVLSNLATASAGIATAQAIPDGTADGVSQSLTLAAGLTVDRVEVTVDIAHTWIGDLEVVLVSPDGTESVLIHRPGQNINTGTGYGLNSDNITFTFSSNAFWGEQGDGRWTLKVRDLQAGDKGTLKSWSMKVYGDETGADDLYVYTDEFGRFGAEAARQVLRDANGGLDTLNAAALTGALVLDLREGAASTIAQRSVTIAQGSVIENAIAGDAADLLIGNAAANRLQGMRGNDRLEGGGGDDVLVGGAGEDTLDGGTGADTAVFEKARSNYAITALDGSRVLVTDMSRGGSDLLTGIEALAFADMTVDLAGVPAGPAVVAADDAVTVTQDRSVTIDVMANDSHATRVLSVLGAAYGTVQIDAAGKVVYTPQAGYVGSDQFTYTVRDAAGAVASATVMVTVKAFDWLEVATIVGTAAADRLVGTTAADTLFGAAGNDRLDGGAGADLMGGGTGNDTYLVDHDGDVVSEAAGGGVDAVSSAVTFTLGAGIENLTLTGTRATNGTGNALANALTGNGAANLLVGGDGADTLKGGTGNDTLDGGDGNDMLDGGADADLMRGGGGDDTYVVGHLDDRVEEGSDAGVELVQAWVSHTLGQNLEKLTLMGSAALDGAGNGLANTLTGNGAANVLRGGGGADLMSGGGGNDTLDGGAGADRMTGGSGADTFVLRRGEIQGDVVTDFSRSGGDKLVLSGFSADATVARLAGSSTDWVIVDRDGTVETVRFTNGASGLLATDWILA